MAALQGLAKMRAIAALGLPQAFVPPHDRPAMWMLRAAGFSGSDALVLTNAGHENPVLLARACSASAMWTANAATIAPAQDTKDHRTHCVVANLRSMPHRAIEAPQTLRLLRAMFADEKLFQVHQALPSADEYGDEGAANHTRLIDGAGMGAHLFVYGMRANGEGARPAQNPARQTLEASERVAHLLGLSATRCVFAQQSPAAIDAGAFHNDVVAVGTDHTLLFHSEAFLDRTATLGALEALVGSCFCPIEVHTQELSMAEAIRTYLFNSQLLTTDSGDLMLVCPAEVREHDRASAVVDRILSESNNSIVAVMYLNVHESMRNGGGPACLRLRVPVESGDLQGIHAGFWITPARADWLQGWIMRHYPEQLSPADLADVQLLVRSRAALDELTHWIAAGPLYAFQDKSEG